jgi:hypothetical protein
VKTLRLVLGLVLSLTAGGTAVAHPEHAVEDSGLANTLGVSLGALAETDLAIPEADGSGVLSALHHTQAGAQHGSDEGHLPPVQKKVKLVGKLDLFGDAEQPGRISDVGVLGDYAYLGAFREPNCEQAGVYVVDISDPANPTEAGFIPATPGAYVGEGVQAITLDTEAFQGDILVHNNENCVPEAGPLVGIGGTSIWNVTDPTNPVALAQHVGDHDPAVDSQPHQSHSVFAWQQGERAYMVQVDNAELGIGDIDIFDITDPANPVAVFETSMADFPEIAEETTPNGSTYLNHDMIVKKVGDRWLLLSNYWDGGYTILDVTNLPNEVTFLRDSDFGFEPFAQQMGLPAEWPSEGNAHQGEFSADNKFVLGADEDFNPYRNTGEVLTGSYSGTLYSATLGSNVPNVPDEGIEGDTEFVGPACTALPPATVPIAIAERGTCTFTIKAQAIQAAGYEMALVMNDKATDPDCDSHVFMLAVADIPTLFVSRSTGLQLLNVPFEDPCATDTPAPFTGGEETALGPVFDGWGYLHLYNAGTMQELDQWAIPEALDVAYAEGFGDLSIHEVATDPSRNIAYISYYGGGFRVVKFGRGGIQEVGAFIDQGGNNFWGVQLVPNSGRRPLVAASDRDSGLYLFRYTG